MSSSNQLIHDSLATLLPRDGDLPPSALDYMKAFLVMLRQLQIYLSCCFAVLLWDYLVTAGDEIRYVWPARFTVVKLCFFINRYLTLAHMIFVMCCAFTTTLLDHCSKIYRIQDYVPIIIFICCNFKLAQRCSALFRNPKPVFYGLMGVIAAQAVVQAVVAFSNIYLPVPPGTTGCYSTPGPGNQKYAFIFWLMPLVTNTIILILSSAKLLQYWSQSGRTHLLEMLLKDGVQYFAVVCSVNIVNVVYLNSKVVYGGVSFDGGAFNSAMALVVTSMMVSRLIIHMRRALAEGDPTTMNIGYGEADGGGRNIGRVPSTVQVHHAYYNKSSSNATSPTINNTTTFPRHPRDPSRQEESATVSLVSKLLQLPLVMKDTNARMRDWRQRRQHTTGAGALTIVDLTLPTPSDGIHDDTTTEKKPSARIRQPIPTYQPHQCDLTSHEGLAGGEKEHHRGVLSRSKLELEDIEMRERYAHDICETFNEKPEPGAYDDSQDSKLLEEGRMVHNVDVRSDGTPRRSSDSLGSTRAHRHPFAAAGVATPRNKKGINVHLPTACSSPHSSAPATLIKRTLSIGSGSVAGESAVSSHPSPDANRVRPFAAADVRHLEPISGIAPMTKSSSSSSSTGHPGVLLISAATNTAPTSTNLTNQILVTTEQVVRMEGSEG